jgi:hypothetical protein
LAILSLQPFVPSADGAQGSQTLQETITGTVTDALGRPIKCGT